jgi:hypothetical protein
MKLPFHRMKRATPKHWCVVRTWRGFPNSVRLFSRERDAQVLAKRWRQAINEDYDEVAVLPVE